MRFLILFLPLLTAVFSGCATTSAGLSIPGNQTFVLGEAQTSDYRAKLDNHGNRDVTAQVIDKATGEVIETVVVPAGGKASLRIAAADQQIHLVNANPREANVKVTMSKNVEGMRYLDDATDIDPAPRPLEEDKSADITRVKKPFRTTVLLPARQTTAVGENFNEPYIVNIKNTKRAKALKISVRSDADQRQTKGFGLGARGNVNLRIDAGETLHIVNEGAKDKPVLLSFDKDVR